MHDQKRKERFAENGFEEEIYKICQKCDLLAVSHGEAERKSSDSLTLLSS